MLTAHAPHVERDDECSYGNARAHTNNWQYWKQQTVGNDTVRHQFDAEMYD